MRIFIWFGFGLVCGWQDGVGREIEPYELDEISPLEEYVNRPGKGN